MLCSDFQDTKVCNQKSDILIWTQSILIRFFQDWVAKNIHFIMYFYTLYCMSTIPSFVSAFLSHMDFCKKHLRQCWLNIIDTSILSSEPVFPNPVIGRIILIRPIHFSSLLMHWIRCVILGRLRNVYCWCASRNRFGKHCPELWAMTFIKMFLWGSSSSHYSFFILCFLLPSTDTFASKVAAIQDQYADASIGNVTGSNAVNVFLGIGVAWTIASVYWNSQGKQFQVPPGSLAFSVTLFTIMALLCFLTLLYRRRPSVSGGELGGPRTTKLLTVFLFLTMWLIYILLSSLEAYCHVPGFWESS